MNRGKILVSLIVSLLWVVGYSKVVLAQRDQTIYQTVIPTTQFYQAEIVSSPVRNIGQSEHLWSVLIDGCSEPHWAPPLKSREDPAIWVEGSYSGTEWTRLRGRALGKYVTPRFEYTIFARGIYPYVRLHVFFFNYMDCFLTARYTGSVYPGEFFTGIAAVGLSETTEVEFESFEFNTIGDNVIVPADLDTAYKVVGFSILNVGANTNHFSLSIGDTSFLRGDLCSKCKYEVPLDVGSPLYSGLYNRNIELTLTTTDKVIGWIKYKRE